MGRCLLARLVRDRLDFDAALLGNAPGRGEALQRVDGGPHHVVRVRRAQALREDVAHAGALEHGAHGAARDHAGSRGRRLQQHAARVAMPTLPCPSPTATSALNPNRRPPFTTFATRLIEMTFSTRPSPSRCRSLESRRSPPRPRPPRPRPRPPPPRPPPPPPPPPRC